MLITRTDVDLPTPRGPMRCAILRPTEGRWPGVVLWSEIFQLTGPIVRTAQRLAGHGNVVIVPEVYHELEPAGTVLGYTPEGTARGNAHKIAKEVASYDDDARACLDALAGDPGCTGRIGTMGMCLGGHLAFRCALDPRVRAAACLYATDIHQGSLGMGQCDDTLARSATIAGELLMIFGRQDPHIPRAGRDRIRSALDDAHRTFTWHELNGQHAFIRDEGPRYDAQLESIVWTLVLDLFHCRLASG
jgi:carboxymethylenebutenolidase